MQPFCRAPVYRLCVDDVNALFLHQQLAARDAKQSSEEVRTSRGVVIDWFYVVQPSLNLSGECAYTISISRTTSSCVFCLGNLVSTAVIRDFVLTPYKPATPLTVVRSAQYELKDGSSRDAISGAFRLTGGLDDVADGRSDGPPRLESLGCHESATSVTSRVTPGRQVPIRWAVARLL